MSVVIDASLVGRVVPLAKSSTSTYTSRVMLRKTLDWAHLLLLLLLVVSPASAGPVRERTYRAATHTRHITQDWQITQRLRRSELRHHSSGSSSRRYSSMGDRTDDASSASSSSPGRSRRMANVHWSKPCTGLLKDPSNTQQDLSGHIIHELAAAHSFLIDFRTAYAKSVLKSNEANAWETVLQNFNHINFSFLDAAPPANPDDFNSQLLHAYEKMQRLAVGIEQATLDQALYEGELLQDFRTIETHIVKILCQLYYAMMHQELQPPENVTKTIMKEKYRDYESSTHRNMRDSVIVREYNAAIDYFKDVFIKFEK